VLERPVGTDRAGLVGGKFRAISVTRREALPELARTTSRIDWMSTVPWPGCQESKSVTIATVA
jgi:hypothetical protein